MTAAVLVGGGGAVSSIGDFFAQTAMSGSMLLAIPIALIAGLVSFASPCVVPLVPGYVGFLGGLAGTNAAAHTAGTKPDSGNAGGVLTKARTTSRVFLGMLLFILGFTVVFVLGGALTGAIGVALTQWSSTIIQVLGVVVIIMGVAFMGAIPVLRNEKKLHVAPKAGLWGAPVLGFVFGLGWTPCLGPTLVAINALALSEGSAGRGAILAAAYSVGLGLPFLLIAVGLERSKRALQFMKKHRLLIMRIGGGLLVLLGLAMVTGLWNYVSSQLSLWAGLTETVV